MGTKLIDRFSYLHFSVGVIFYYWKIGLVPSIILHTFFEVVENTEFGMSIINKYITLWPGGKSKADTFVNNVGDTIFFILGWLSAHYIYKL
jgi:hypothetical protein